MTKANTIRNLYSENFFTVREIAAIVGCSDSYVRVCARQRVGGKLGPADHNYKTRCMTGKSREEAREKARAAYRAMRDAGRSVKQAEGAYRDTWKAVMMGHRAPAVNETLTG